MTLRARTELEMTTGVQQHPEKDEKIIEREHIPGTPFEMITHDGLSFATYGKYKISLPHGSKDEALNWIYENQFNVMNTMIAIMLENYDEFKLHSVSLNNGTPKE